MCPHVSAVALIISLHKLSSATSEKKKQCTIVQYTFLPLDAARFCAFKQVQLKLFDPYRIFRLALV